MAFPTLDLLGPVVAALVSSNPGCLDRLAIYDTRARLRVPLYAHPHSIAQGGVHPFPCSIQAPQAEVVVAGLPGREVVRQESPGAAAPHNVEDGVEDLTQGVYPRASGSSRDGNMRLD